MTPEEAIAILTIDNDHNPDITDADRGKAHQLGIEALKRVLECGYPARCGLMERLPGETDE